LAWRPAWEKFAGLCHVWERAFDKEDVAVKVVIEGPFLLVVHLIEGERSGRNYREKLKRGREWKARKAGRSSLAGRTQESLPRENKGGGREISTLLLLQNSHHSHTG